jgi:hypothetical protein
MLISKCGAVVEDPLAVQKKKIRDKNGFILDMDG